LNKIQKVDEREKKNVERYCREKNSILRYRIFEFDEIVNFRRDRRYIVEKSKNYYYRARKIVERAKKIVKKIKKIVEKTRKINKFRKLIFRDSYR